VIVAASRIQSQHLPMAPPTESNSHSAGQNGKQRMYLTDAAQDLLSHAGRIIPDLRTIQELGQTAFHGGLVDDRKYLVCSCSFHQENVTHKNRSRILSRSRPPCQIHLDCERRSRTRLSALYGTIWSILLCLISGINSNIGLQMEAITYASIPRYPIDELINIEYHVPPSWCFR
jgi:hypothetical protein